MMLCMAYDAVLLEKHIFSQHSTPMGHEPFAVEYKALAYLILYEVKTNDIPKTHNHKYIGPDGIIPADLKENTLIPMP